jgi:hypothetical protein
MVKEKQMAKVVIKGLAARKQAKDHKKVTAPHKPASKTKPAKANVSKPGLGGFSYSKTSTPAQDKAYNSKNM